MAGYSGFSKSNNAIDAENSGLMTAGVIAKKIGKGATAAGVAEVLQRAEWHHTSLHYNCTNYYEYEIGTKDAEIIASSKKTNENVILTKATVTWLEWSGTRNRPIATEKTVKDCIINYFGKAFCKITLPTNKIMKKKLSTRGFKINGQFPENALSI